MRTGGAQGWGEGGGGGLSRPTSLPAGDEMGLCVEVRGLLGIKVCPEVFGARVYFSLF